jgi:CheY-like chemotaxis protein
VDDDPEVRAVTSAYLTEMGHRVIEAPDGASAIDVLRTDRQIDILVADFAMPGMTGFDLALKAREHRDQIGVLLVTGYADPDKMAKGFPLLHKPFGRAELAAKITEVTSAILSSSRV